MKVYDADIRRLLFHSFLKDDEYISQDTIIVNELNVCAGISTADIALINGKIHGFEIKSKQDTLGRLPQQIQSYNKVFDTMTIVAFESHINNIKKIIPKWWGIKCVTEKNGKIYLKNIRKAKQNRDINWQSVASLLWKDEMINLLLTHGNLTKGYKGKTRHQLSKMIAERIDGTTIADYVRNTLKSRTNWKAVPLLQLSDDLHSIQPN